MASSQTTSSDQIAGSTSTQGPSNEGGARQAPTRLRVRHLTPLLTATQVTQETPLALSDGAQPIATPGDWIISQGKIALALVRQAHFPGSYEIVHEGTLLLLHEQRAAIEAVAGLGSTRTPATLLQAIQRLATIAIGEVQIPFTPGQLEELKHRAGKRGRSVEAEIQSVVDRIKDELFWKS